MNINKEYKRKEEDSMSFIGMKICNNGIVAFGDSKSSKYINGCLTCDKERGEIQKIFKHDNFIISTWGINEIIVNNNKVDWIEDVMNLILSSCKDKEDFLEQFKNYLFDSKNIQEFHFLIGYKDTHYQIIEYKVNAFYVLPISYEHYNGSKYAGDVDYMKKYNQLRYKDKIDSLEFSLYIKKEIERMIEDFEEKLDYNPVGLPVNVEIFQ